MPLPTVFCARSIIRSEVNQCLELSKELRAAKRPIPQDEVERMISRACAVLTSVSSQLLRVEQQFEERLYELVSAVRVHQRRPQVLAEEVRQPKKRKQVDEQPQPRAKRVARKKAR